MAASHVDRDSACSTPYPLCMQRFHGPASRLVPRRDGMKRNEWLCLVAVHSDSWLMSVAFYNAARLDAEGRCAGVV